MKTDSGTQLQVSATQEVSVSKNTGDKKVSNMETELLRAQERYTSKNSVLVWNPPFDARAVDDVTDAIIDFFRTSLKVNISRGGIKACHMYMGNYGNNIPTINCKFVYFDDKHAVYKARRNLKNQKNILSKRNIYITERLPEQEAIIKKAANDMDLITTTHKCIVSVLVHDEKRRGKTKFMRNDAVDELQTINAVKRKKRIYTDSRHDNNEGESPANKKPTH